MQRVYIAESLIDAQLLLDQLHAGEVAAVIFHANSPAALGELPVTYPEVWIQRDLDLAKADRIVARFTHTPMPHQRTCPHCGETNPTNFEICWQCYQPMPPA